VTGSRLLFPSVALAVALAVVLAAACASDDDPIALSDDGPAVVARYAEQVDFAYGQSVESARAMQTAILAFTAAPSESTHQAAKDAWLAARDPYGLTEAFRFYDGPIDSANSGPEGQINAWPMDEAYVDYVEGMPDAGIVNDPDTTIDAATLIGLNEAGGETNIATGWHAIEFLLWGQDLSADGPGARPYTDFVDGGPIANADRRRRYLEVTTALLVADLEGVHAQWAPGSGYAATFVELPLEESLAKVMRGIGALAGGELAGERINVAFETKEQEDEHSCFSDNTHKDIANNFFGIEAVYFASFSGDGPSLDDMIEARDPALAQTLRTRFADLHAQMDQLPAPFDQAIAGADTTPGRTALRQVIAELRALSDDLVAAADVLGFGLNVEI
jgi:putative iron-regulated protein